MAGPENSISSSRAVFSCPGFTNYLVARFFIVAALEMQSVAVGWQVYEITKRPLDLGLVGLAQFLPGIFLFLIAGHTADRFDRRSVLLICYGGFAACSGLLLLIGLRGATQVLPIYAVLVLLGVVRTFNWPAGRSLFPQLVPEEHFSSAVAWNSTVFQAANILGPTVGGLLYASFRGPELVYASSLTAALGALVSLLGIKLRRVERPREPVSARTVFAGLAYIWRQKLVLGSISRSVCRSAGRRGGPASRFCPRDPEDRPLGPWASAQRARSGRGHHGPPACVPAAAPPGGSDHALGGCRLWNFYHCVWALAQPGRVSGGVVPGGCG